MDNDRYKTFPTEEEPCIPCEAEKMEGIRPANLQGAFNRALPFQIESTEENLIEALNLAIGVMDGELSKMYELRDFIESNDVPKSVIDRLFNDYRYFLQQAQMK